MLIPITAVHDVVGTVIRFTDNGLQIKWVDGKITDHGFDAMNEYRIAP